MCFSCYINYSWFLFVLLYLYTCSHPFVYKFLDGSHKYIHIFLKTHPTFHCSLNIKLQAVATITLSALACQTLFYSLTKYSDRVQQVASRDSEFFLFLHGQVLLLKLFSICKHNLFQFNNYYNILFSGFN